MNHLSLFCVAVHGCSRNALQIADKTCNANFWMVHFFCLVHLSQKMNKTFQNSFHIIKVKSLFINSLSQILNIILNRLFSSGKCTLGGKVVISSVSRQMKWAPNATGPGVSLYYSSDENAGPSTAMKWANRRHTEANRFCKEQILYFTCYHFL